jgi:hypothetical protein
MHHSHQKKRSENTPRCTCLHRPKKRHAMQVQLVKAALAANELEFDRQHLELAKTPTAVEDGSGVQSRDDVMDEEP